MYICNWSTLNKLIIIIKSWFDVPKTQISIFIIFARTGVLFDDAFSVKVSLRISWSVNVTESQETENLITFTEEILNGKLHFLRSVCLMQKRRTRKKWNKAIFFFRLWYFHFAFPQKDGCYINQKITSQLRYLHRRR